MTIEWGARTDEAAVDASADVDFRVLAMLDQPISKVDEDGDHDHTGIPCRTCVVLGVPKPWPIDLPLEAFDWAQQLVDQGYRDAHIVTFTEDGYGLEHPIRCRPNLIGCVLNEWLATQMAPDREPGRYVMEWTDTGPRYEPVAA